MRPVDFIVRFGVKHMSDDWGNRFFESLRPINRGESFKANEIMVEEYPRKQHKPGCMTIGRTEPGIKVTHIETGKYSICTEHRQQYRNKKTAILKLQRRLKT
jgi:protein subunit release factor A